jgi:hypothetical protein
MPGPFASCSHQISCHCADKLSASRNNGRQNQAKIEGVPLVLTTSLFYNVFEVQQAGEDSRLDTVYFDQAEA